MEIYNRNRLITQIIFSRCLNFDRKAYTIIVAFADRDFVRKLRTTIITRDESAVISEFASLTEGWELGRFRRCRKCRSK